VPRASLPRPILGLLGLLALLTGCASAPPTPSPAPSASSSTAIPEARPATRGAPSVGGLKLGLGHGAVEALLGPPASKAAPYEEGASGAMLSEWVWPTRGVKLLMAMASDGSATIHGITASAPCTLRTAEDVGIGSPRAAVLAAYGAEVSTEHSTEGHVSIGGPYNGFGFDLEGGKVSAIHIYQGAE
jgi:hypothetical protein